MEFVFDALSKQLRLPIQVEMFSFWDFRQGFKRDQDQQFRDGSSAGGSSDRVGCSFYPASGWLW